MGVPQLNSLAPRFVIATLGLVACACAAPVAATPPPAAPRVKRAAAESVQKAPPLVTQPEATSEAPAPPPAPPTCPEGMALVERYQGAYCIDRWEAALVRLEAGAAAVTHPFNQNVDGIEAKVSAVSRRGVRAQGYISGKQAARACSNAGKRLCEVDEWVRACRGPKLTRYPYGDERRPNLCNDRFKVLDHHPVPILWKKDPQDPLDEKLMWHPRFMNDKRLLELPNTTAPTGAYAKCTNDYGVYDMVGNQHEWVNDPEGTFFGGFFMDTFQNGQGCEYRTGGHPFDYHDYSTGFRCCADPRVEP